MKRHFCAIEIDALLTGANPNLPKGAVAELFEPHVEHLTMAIDALAARDATTAYAMLHTAGHQTQSIMDPLAAAIAQAIPRPIRGRSDVVVGHLASESEKPR